MVSALPLPLVSGTRHERMAVLGTHQRGVVNQAAGRSAITVGLHGNRGNLGTINKSSHTKKEGKKKQASKQASKQDRQTDRQTERQVLPTHLVQLFSGVCKVLPSQQWTSKSVQPDGCLWMLEATLHLAPL